MAAKTVDNLIIRLETPADYKEVERLTFEAFETFECEGIPPIDTFEHFQVHLMRDDPVFVPELDFVAEIDGEIVGNIMYSLCLILCFGKSRDSYYITALNLDPLSVKPEWQRQGVGTRLTEYSLARAKELGYVAVILNGEPSFYSRFGFVPAWQFGLMASGNRTDSTLAMELQHGSLESAVRLAGSCAAIHASWNNKEAFQAFHREFENDFAERK